MPGGTVSYNGSYSGPDCYRLTTSQRGRGLAGGGSACPSPNSSPPPGRCDPALVGRDVEIRSRERRSAEAVGGSVRSLNCCAGLGADGASARVSLHHVLGRWVLAAVLVGLEPPPAPGAPGGSTCEQRAAARSTKPARAVGDDLQAVEGLRQRVTAVASLGHDLEGLLGPEQGRRGAPGRDGSADRGDAAPRIPSRPVSRAALALQVVPFRAMGGGLGRGRGPAACGTLGGSRRCRP